MNEITIKNRKFHTRQQLDENLRFYDVQEPPFSIHGLPGSIRQRFTRLPDDILPACSPNVQVLAANTAGGRVRFRTNARRLFVAVRLKDTHFKTHMTPSAHSGLELFADSRKGEMRIALIRPLTDGDGGLLDGYRLLDSSIELIELPGGSMLTYTLYLPLFNGLEQLLIGIDGNSRLAPAPPYTITPPIVFYGSSITQGACAGRPSMSYTALLCRWLHADLHNLGFAGNALGEHNIAEYIASLPMSAFVLDYDYNAPSSEHLRATHDCFFRTIRKAQPDLPILMLSAPNFNRKHHRAEQREVVRQTYQQALNRGDKLVWFVDGDHCFSTRRQDLCLMDEVHPNDIGFMTIAENLLPVLRQMIN